MAELLNELPTSQVLGKEAINTLCFKPLRIAL